MSNLNVFGVVREYWSRYWELCSMTNPQVLHHGQPNTGMILEEGMTFTIEPMVNGGDWKTKLLGDKWTVVTKDHSLSAQVEHTHFGH